MVVVDVEFPHRCDGGKSSLEKHRLEREHFFVHGFTHTCREVFHDVFPILPVLPAGIMQREIVSGVSPMRQWNPYKHVI